MQAIRDRQQELTDEKNYREFVLKQETKQRMHEETMQCRWIGTNSLVNNNRLAHVSAALLVGQGNRHQERT